MLHKNTSKRVLFGRTLASALFGVFGMAAILYGGFAFHPAKTYAATNSTINFQARLENTAGAIAPDGNYNVEFKLYNASTGGSLLWTEDYLNSAGKGVHTANGYLTVNLGSVTGFPTTINWDQDLYLTMNIGGTSPTTPSYDGEMNPRLKLTSVPYAFRAGQLATLQGGNTSTLGFTSQTSANSILLPNESGTLCIQNSANCGFLTGSAANGTYVQLQSGSPGTTQTGNLNISGTSLASKLQAGLSTDALYSYLSANDLTFNRNGLSYISNATVGGAIGIQVSNSSSLDTLALDIRSNGNVGIGTSGAAYKLDVQGGDVNTSGVYRINGTPICTASGCTAAAGSGNYIQLQSGSPGTAQTGNLNITGTATAGTVNATNALQTAGVTRIDASGNLTNIGNIAGSGTLQLSGTGTSYLMGALGLGTTSPQSGSALTIANGSWISSVDASGSGYVNLFQVNSNNQIQVGAALNIDGGILLPTNGGQLTFSDLPIDTTATAGTPESYSLRVGSSNALTVYGEADGAGNAQNLRVAIGSSITPGYTLDVGGDINASGVYRQAGTAGITQAACAAGTVFSATSAGGIVTGGSCVSVASGSGNGNYIQNGTALQTANFAIQSASASSVGGIIKGASGQTSDLLQVTNSSSTALLRVGANGYLSLGSPSVAGSAGRSYFADGSGDGFTANINTTTLTANQTISLPNESGTICLQNSANCGFLTGSAANGSYIQLQSGTPGVAQTGNLNISGTAIAGVLQAGSLTVTGAGNSSFAGNVGIGTTAPGYKLDVQGGDINTSGSYRVGGVAGATTTCTGGNVLQNATVSGGIVTGGTCTVNGGGVAPTLQNVYDNSAASPLINLSNTGKGLFIQDAATSVGGNLFAIQNNAGTTQYLAVTTSGASVAGTFSVSGAVTGGTYNGQTISSAASFTGTLTVSGVATLNSSATIAGPLTVSSTSSSVFGNGTTGSVKIGDGTISKASGSGFQLNSSLNVTNGLQIGGAAASGQFLRGNGTYFVSSGIQAADIPAGSSNYIQNGASVQSGANFNVSGNGTVGGTLYSNAVDTATAGTLNLGSTNATAINLGGGTVSETLGIGNSSGNDTVNIATAAGTDAVNIGTNTTSQSTVGLGSSYSTTTVKLQGGSNYLFVGNAGLGIGTATPGYKLDVQGGDINTSGSYRVGGTIGVARTCSSGQYLDGQTTLGGIVTGGSCVAVPSGGGAPPTLQNVYDNSAASPIINLSSTGKGLFVRDASTSVGGNLFAIQNNAGTTQYLAVTTSGASVAGTFSASTALLGPLVDTATATALNIGTNNATVINLNENTAIASGKTLAVNGSTTIATTGANAFVVQSAGAATLLTANTSTMQVVIGSGSNTVAISANGIVLSGNARNAKVIRLVPEYGGAVLDAGTMSNNSGTMTSGIDLTNSHNYYKWTTTQSSNQSYDIDIQVPIPSDFAAWNTSTPLSIYAYTSDTTNGTIKLEARDTGGSVETGCNFVNVTPATATTWASNTSACSLSGTYTAGGSMTLRVRLQSPLSGDVRASEIVLNYLSKY